MERIGVAVVGAAEWLTRYHLPALRSTLDAAGFYMCGIWNRTGEKAARVAGQFGIPHVYTSFDELMGDDAVQAVVCVVSKEASYDLLLALSEKGVPLLVEKPPAESAVKAERLAREVRVPTLVAFNRRYAPFHQHLVKLVRDVPCVDLVHCALHRRNRNDTTFIVETGVHGIDFLSLLGGSFEHMTTELRDSGTPGVHSAVVLGRLSGGAAAQLSFLPFAGAARESYDLYTPDCCARLEMAQAYIDTRRASFEEWRNDGTEGAPAHRVLQEPVESADTTPQRGPTLAGSGYLEIYAEFGKLARGELQGARSTLQTAAAALRVAEAIDSGYSGPL